VEEIYRYLFNSYYLCITTYEQASKREKEIFLQSSESDQSVGRGKRKRKMKFKKNYAYSDDSDSGNLFIFDLS